MSPHTNIARLVVQYRVVVRPVARSGQKRGQPPKDGLHKRALNTQYSDCSCWNSDTIFKENNCIYSEHTLAKAVFFVCPV